MVTTDFSEPVSPITSRAALRDAPDGVRFCEEGTKRYRAGAVACVTVAGGQGSRLGWSGPKATFPVYPDGTTLLAIHAAKIARLQARYGVPAPWLIMTSDHTHDATLGEVVHQGFYGLPTETIRCIPQESLPVRSLETGAPLIIDGTPLTAPGGHGGFLTSPAIRVALEQLFEQGVECLLYNQIDNLLCRYDDPLFIGYAASLPQDGAVKLLSKQDPHDRLGTLVHHEGRDCIVEYSELPSDIAAARTEDGSLVFGLGSPSMYCFRLSSLLSRWSDFSQLPIHELTKEIPLSGGDLVLARKGERFIHDAFGRYLSMIGFVVDRADEFAPIKVPHAAESPEDARERAAAAYRRWFDLARMNREREKAEERDSGVRHRSEDCELKPEFGRFGCVDDVVEQCE